MMYFSEKNNRMNLNRFIEHNIWQNLYHTPYHPEIPIPTRRSLAQGWYDMWYSLLCNFTLYHVFEKDSFRMMYFAISIYCKSQRCFIVELIIVPPVWFWCSNTLWFPFVNFDWNCCISRFQTLIRVGSLPCWTFLSSDNQKNHEKRREQQR